MRFYGDGYKMSGSNTEFLGKINNCRKETLSQKVNYTNFYGLAILEQG
jgi:hypothetical protein